MKTKVTLVNSGQDFLSFICDEKGKVLKVLPEPALLSIWLGSYLPVNDTKLMQEGLHCPIRKAYASSYGYLNHRIEKIEIL